MAENQLIFGLKRKYGQTLGLIAAGQDRREDLAHLAAVIRMFRPETDLSAIKPIRPYLAQKNRWSREALAILRNANAPMTPRAIANRILAARGLPLTRPYQQRIECSLHAVFERLEGRGLVRAEGSPKRWSIEP